MAFYKLYKNRTDYHRLLYPYNRMMSPEYYTRLDAKRALVRRKMALSMVAMSVITKALDPDDRWKIY